MYTIRLQKTSSYVPHNVSLNKSLTVYETEGILQTEKAWESEKDMREKGMYNTGFVSMKSRDKKRQREQREQRDDLIAYPQ